MAEVSFGEWLKRRRMAAGWTQAQLALQISCSTSALKKIEREERRPSTQIVQRIADIFDIAPQEQPRFLRFARGDSQAEFSEILEDAPWRTPTRSASSNLPATPSSLIGRDLEIAAVRDYLVSDGIRLVTLIGPPGIGKTRLSIESARTASLDFPDGVFFVALAPLNDPTLLAVTVAQALGYVGVRNRSAAEQLKEGIGDKPILIVLDNCEHLIEDVARLASLLLSACSQVRILATSRESLRISGEWLYPVPALEAPREPVSTELQTASNFPALALFVERARAVRPDFDLNSENINAVSAICTRLDGLPLAIELIAARVRLMPPKALLERLDDQFILSADGMRAASTRQNTLRNAIGWSYNLLSQEEQELFAYLSVFSGRFTLKIAEKIFSEKGAARSVGALIASLFDKSLLQRALPARGEAGLTMLVTIRQFALDQLRQMGKEANVRNRHLAYLIDVAASAEQEMRGARQIEWLRRLDALSDDLRAALEWAIETRQTQPALQLARKLHWYWFVRGDYTGAPLARTRSGTARCAIIPSSTS